MIRTSKISRDVPDDQLPRRNVTRQQLRAAMVAAGWRSKSIRLYFDSSCPIPSDPIRVNGELLTVTDA